MVLLGLPMWLFALVGGSLAFAIADILCDIVISEGDSHEVGSAEDSDAEEGTEMTATPRRDASKASKPGYAPVANQSTPALPPRGEPAWSEPSPVKATYLADGQSADASLSGTQDAAISGLVTATWLLGSVVYKLVLAPGALAHASAVEMRWRPDTHIEFWFAMLGGLCAFLHNFYLLKAFEGAPSTVLLPLILSWYANDFGRGRPIDLVKFVYEYMSGERHQLLTLALDGSNKNKQQYDNNSFQVKFANYDFSCRNITLLDEDLLQMLMTM